MPELGTATRHRLADESNLPPRRRTLHNRRGFTRLAIWAIRTTLNGSVCREEVFCRAKMAQRSSIECNHLTFEPNACPADTIFHVAHGHSKGAFLCTDKTHKQLYGTIIRSVHRRRSRGQRRSDHRWSISPYSTRDYSDSGACSLTVVLAGTQDCCRDSRTHAEPHATSIHSIRTNPLLFTIKEELFVKIQKLETTTGWLREINEGLVVCLNACKVEKRLLKRQVEGEIYVELLICGRSSSLEWESNAKIRGESLERRPRRCYSKSYELKSRANFKG